MSRGGPRPGAGAPQGNLNAYKHGRNSRQYGRLLQIIAADPEALALIREVTEGERIRKAHRERQARRLLDELFRRV
jgi:hypothetical protein